MIWAVVLLIAAAVSMLVMGVAGVVTDPETKLVRRRLEAAPGLGIRMSELRERRRRRRSRESLEAFLEAFGARVSRDKDRVHLKDMLLHAGYRRRSAGMIFMGTRVALACLLGLLAVCSRDIH